MIKVISLILKIICFIVSVLTLTILKVIIFILTGKVLSFNSAFSEMYDTINGKDL